MITATYHNMLNIVNKLFGGLGSNNLKKYDNIVKKINNNEPEISSLSDEELNKKTPTADLTYTKKELRGRDCFENRVFPRKKSACGTLTALKKL